MPLRHREPERTGQTMTSSITNFACIDDVLWRGARPAIREQADWLITIGARSIINLEYEQSDAGIYGGLPSAIDLYVCRDFEPLPYFAPSMEDRHIHNFLAILRAAKHPCFTHCRSGQNRTGVAVAAYRLVDRRDPLPEVLVEFRAYRGWWASADLRYLRDLATRTTEFR